MKRLICTVMAICALWSCGEKKVEMTLSGLNPSDFESTVQGKRTQLYVLTNKNGAEACITNYGGRLVSLMMPDKNGKMTDVVLGYDNIEQYDGVENYGALIGRYGNRIANGKFTLDGNEYTLPQNNNGHCLHGGPEGYDTRMWDAEQIDPQTIKLTYQSKDGEAGFPGNLDVTVTYTLTDDNAIDIKYEAETDKKTIVNLTNHSYFNLSGIPGSTILDHNLAINADKYVPVDSTLIPLGGLADVAGTPMDLRNGVTLGDSIDLDFQQLTYGGGYDHNWCLNTEGDINKVAATLYSPTSGIVMEVYTNEPGLQFYAGNCMTKEGVKGKHGAIYPYRGAVCLETQHYPDSPNQADFPSVVLNPGEKYSSECIYKFSTK
jgi:aldose 1-epimerase